MIRSCSEPYYIHLVFEYLLHLGLRETMSVFKTECNNKGFHIPKNIGMLENSKKSTVLKNFDFAQRDVFFENLWLIIPDMTLQSTEIRKLIADLYVHFALVEYSSYKDTKDLSMRSDEENSPTTENVQDNKTYSTKSLDSFSDNPSIKYLINFLEQYCNHLRADSEFIPYFSLPLVSDPYNHHLFLKASQDKWVESLRRRLEDFLQYCSVDKVPDIVLYMPSYLYWQNETNNLKESYPACSYFSHQDSHDIVHLDVDGDDKVKENYNGFVKNSEQLSSENEDSSLFSRKPNNQLSRGLPCQGIRESVSNSEVNAEENQLSYMELKQKFSQLHTDYHNLIGVASELTDALESSVRGQTIDLRETLSNCIQIFPELFANSKYQEQCKSKPNERRFSAQASQCDWKLNMALIKTHLMEGNMKSRLLLLQALRWAITKSYRQKREYIMMQFVSYDLLNLQGKLILSSLLMPAGVVTPHPVQQSSARLLNALASVQSGRSYLSQNPEAVNVISAVLQQHGGFNTDTFTKNMLVAALQKLSLRRDQRIAMIQAGMVEWLLEHLSGVDLDSPYSLEYGTALLMNLLLHQSAKERCVPIASRVIKIFINLLSTSITQALPYINGAVYSIVAHHKLNEAAAEEGLSQALKKILLKQGNADIRRQMEHILQYHQSLLHNKDTHVPLNEGEMIDEDSEELDLLGEELDEHDPVRSINGELYGEDLLKTHYIFLNNAEMTMPLERCSSSVPSRPMTPQFFSLGINVPAKDIGTVSWISQECGAESNNWYQSKASPKPQECPSEQLWKKSSGLTETHEDKPEGENSSKDLLNNLSNLRHRASMKGWIPTSQSLPRISIQMVSKGDTENSDSNKDIDEDSDDVQVASTRSTNDSEGHPETETEEDGLQKHSQNSEKNDVTASAFVTRAKIPRTPPHHC